MKGFEIEGVEVKPGRAFVIAEVGSNFNGDMETAKKLIDVAVTAKADAVKFQTFKAEKVITASEKKPAYQTTDGDTESYQESLKKFEISEDEHHELIDYCKEKGIIFISTPHGQEESVDLLEKLGVSSYKIASGDVTNMPFLEYVAKTGKPIFLSTGMSTISEIKRAVDAIKKEGNEKLVVMQCTSSYPCKVEDVNLLAMKTIEKECNCLIGLSDHTTTVSVSAAAVALGAVAIEKHFTLDKNDKGPDHQASLEPAELAKAVSQIREVEKALGSAEKKPTESELKLSKIIRKSVVAACDIKAGEELSKEMVEIKRPGTGIPPFELEKVIGKKAKRDIKGDELVSFDDLE